MCVHSSSLFHCITVQSGMRTVSTSSYNFRAILLSLGSSRPAFHCLTSQKRLSCPDQSTPTVPSRTFRGVNQIARLAPVKQVFELLVKRASLRHSVVSDIFYTGTSS